MNPGDLRNKIEVKKPSTVIDDFGQSSTEYELVRTTWAAITPAIGRNYYAAQQTQTEANIKMNTRYFSDIKKNMRVYHGDVIYDIIDVMDVNFKHEELVIMCKEAVL